jgi:hypothetical protein
MSLKRWFMLAILLPVGCALALAALPLFFVAGRHVASAAPTCVNGPGGLAAYYFDGSKGTLNLSDGRTWVMTLTDIDGSGVTGNKTYHLLVQDQGYGSGWETLPTQTHHGFYGAGGHLLQSDDKDWTVRSSHGFNPGDVSGTYDLRVVMSQRTDDKWDISPYFRLPGGNWTLFYDGAWTTATAFNLTQTRLAVQIDGGGGGTLCFTAPTANAVDLTNAFVDDDWVGLPNDTQVFFPGDPNPHFIGLDAFATIQDGISNVQGSTVNVAAGTYTETGQIVISKNLTITGDPANKPVIKPAQDTGASGDTRGWFLVNSGVTFNLNNVVLDGAGYKIWQAIRSHGSGTIESNTLQNILYDPSSAYQGTGIVFDTASMTVKDNTFTNIGRIGMFAFGPGVTAAVISGNTYTGKGAGNWLDYGVEVGGGAHATVTRNTISGNTGVASDSSTSAGIIVTTYYDSGTQATITENFISGSTTGVGVGYDASDTSAVTVFNNSLTANTKGVESTAPLIDASGNWWGTQTPDGVAGEVSADVDYTPWLDSSTDKEPDTPGFQGDFSTLDVDDDSPQSGATGRVQEGVNLVSGSTVNVAAGTYDEQVVIGKSLTLQGAGDSTVVLPSSDAKLTTILSGRFWGVSKQIAGIVVANVPDGSSVTMKNLKVDGASVTAKPAGADYVAGVFYRETGGTIDAVTVTNMTVGTTGTAVRGDGIYLSAVANTVSVEVKGSNLTNYDKNGIDAWGNKLSVNIHGDTLTGRGPLPQGDEVQNGAVIGDGAAGTVDQNTISNHTYSPETWWSAGIEFLDSGGSSSATGNTLTNNQMGVIFQDGNGSASGNTVSGGKLGLNAQATKAGTWTASFTGNTVSGSDTTGIGGETYDPGASLSVTVADNSLTGGTGDGVAIGDFPEYEPAGSVAATITGNFISGWPNGVNLLSSVAGGSTIYSNSIAGNASRGVLNQTGVVANASGNWWGINTPTGVAGQVSANVDYTPWLNSGTDKNPGTPGFQGDFSTLNVDDDSPQTGATGRIQEGVNMVSGSTVKVWPGTYSEQVLANGKTNLTIQGMGPPNPKVTAGPGTTAPIIHVKNSSNVTIKGLEIDGAGNGASPCPSSGGPDTDKRFYGIRYSNSSGTVSDNQVHGIRYPTICGSAVGIYAYQSGVQISGNTVYDFDKNGITANMSGSSTIAGNTVTGWGPSAAVAQNGIQVGYGATGTVDGNTVSDISYTGDYWAASGILVTSYTEYGYPLSSADLTGNTVTNAQVGIYYGEGSGTASGNIVSASAAGVGMPAFWGIVVVDPPGRAASPFEDEAAPPAGGGAAAPMGAGVMTVVVSGNTLTGDGSVDSAGLYADAGYPPYGTQNVDFTASGNTISNWGTGVAVDQCTEDCSTGVFVAVDVGPNNDVSAPIADPSNSGLHAMGSVNLNVHNNTFTGGYDAIKLRLSVTGTVKDNVVSGYAKNGITVGKAADNNPGTNVTVSGNTVTGGGPGQGNAQNGIQVGPNAVARIENNTVSNHVYTLGEGACAGSGTKGDAAYYDACWTAAGIMVYQGTATVMGNIVAGNQVGIDDSGAEVHYNEIRDNIIYGENNTSGGTANAENNWWGSCSGPSHPSNPLGTGDAVSDNVDFDPWIHGACDADGDLLTDDAEKLTWFTDWQNPDTDSDGCADGEEALYSDPSLGGQRDPTNSYDFYDISDITQVVGSKDKVVSGFDLNILLHYLNSFAGDGGLYDGDTNGKNGPDGAEMDFAGLNSLWPNSGPDGAISGFDLNDLLIQVNASCAAPP